MNQKLVRKVIYFHPEHLEMIKEVSSDLRRLKDKRAYQSEPDLIREMIFEGLHVLVTDIERLEAEQLGLEE